MRLFLAALLALSAASCAKDERWNSIYGMPDSGVVHDNNWNRTYGMPDSPTGKAGAATPPLESSRRVVDQDCSNTVAVDQGNLRCR